MLSGNNGPSARSGGLLQAEGPNAIGAQFMVQGFRVQGF